MKELKKYYIKTYGCAMNYADSDRIRFVLNGVNLKEVNSFKEADLVVLNSCSVRKQAEDKIAGWGIKAKTIKEKVFLLTGCMAVRHDRKNGGLVEKHTKYLKRKFPWINHIVDITEIESIPEVLKLEKVKENQKESYLNLKPVTESKSIANVPISTGCNFFCSYCIVPFSRGELLQRSYEEIMKEVDMHLNNGIKLICLVAQNVNSWVGMKDGRKVDFADLLNDIGKMEGDFWITFVSSNPMDFSEKIIDAISKNSKIMRWLNIAVQSGSDEVLKKMNRRYTVREFEDLIKKIRKKIPDIRLTTDIIVGFPGEAGDDFEKTFNFVKNIEFEMIYIGKYSPRKLALSANLVDDVPQQEKKRREDILKDEVNRVRGILHKNLVGKKMKILVTGGRRGLSYNYHEILLEKPVQESKVGNFLEVRITGSSLSGLVAKEEGIV